MSFRKTAKDISDKKISPRHIGPKSFEVKKQELISHTQNYQETFSRYEKKEWIEKLNDLVEAIEK